MNIPLKLSSVKPDFESILMQLQLYLNSSSDGRKVWKDLQTAGTGEAIMEMIAAVSTFNQMGIELAAREGFLSTAVRDSSIYAITSMLGVRIHRKLPAGVDVALVRPDNRKEYSEILPKFTQFDCDGKKFFNRFSLMFTAGSTKASERIYYGVIRPFLDNKKFKLDLDVSTDSVLQGGEKFKYVVNHGGGKGTEIDCELIKGIQTYFEIVNNTDLSKVDSFTRGSLIRESIRLYEGAIVSEVYISDGMPFKKYTLNESNFNISDVDVEVKIRNDDTDIEKIWSNISEGLWNAKNEEKYYDFTSGFGQAIIAFGNNVNGITPPLGNKIVFRYAITNGNEANNGVKGLDVNCLNDPLIQGKTVSTISGGSDHKPATYYKTMAPHMFKAKNRAVNEDDYLAITLSYPGIISAKILAQRDIAPDDLRWMNVVQICALPLDESIDAMSNLEKSDFLNYINARKHHAVQLVLRDPDKEFADIDLVIALKKSFVSSEVLPRVEQSLRALFSRRTDTLGRIITESDVIQHAMVDGVDYVSLNVCKSFKQDSSEVVENINKHDLGPSSKTTFLVLRNLTVNSKYSERLIYSGD